jgi:hypothetical protein
LYVVDKLWKERPITITKGCEWWFPFFWRTGAWKGGPKGQKKSKKEYSRGRPGPTAIKVLVCMGVKMQGHIDDVGAGVWRGEHAEAIMAGLIAQNCTLEWTMSSSIKYFT